MTDNEIMKTIVTVIGLEWVKRKRITSIKIIKSLTIKKHRYRIIFEIEFGSPINNSIRKNLNPKTTQIIAKLLCMLSHPAKVQDHFLIYVDKTTFTHVELRGILNEYVPLQNGNTKIFNVWTRT